MEGLKFCGLMAMFLGLCFLMGVAVLGKVAVTTTAGMIAAPFVGLIFVVVICGVNDDRRRDRR